ncbi:MAG: hypothetical protein WC360_03220 [Opitutales bacterium]|jgi:hypothetical protein
MTGQRTIFALTIIAAPLLAGCISIVPGGQGTLRGGGDGLHLGGNIGIRITDNDSTGGQTQDGETLDEKTVEQARKDSAQQPAPAL